MRLLHFLLQLVPIALCCVLLTSVCSAQNNTIYKVVNADGTITYTDTPSQDAEAFTLEKQTANQAQPLSPSTSITVPSNNSQDDTQYQLGIVSPEPDATIRNNAGDIVIKATPITHLNNASYQLVFDGKTVETNRTGLFKLTNVDRGAHVYQIRLLNNTGKTLALTPQQTLFLHRASVLIYNN